MDSRMSSGADPVPGVSNRITDRPGKAIGGRAASNGKRPAITVADGNFIVPQHPFLLQHLPSFRFRPHLAAPGRPLQSGDGGVIPYVER